MKLLGTQLHEYRRSVGEALEEIGRRNSSRDIKAISSVVRSSLQLLDAGDRETLVKSLVGEGLLPTETPLEEPTPRKSKASVVAEAVLAGELPPSDLLTLHMEALSAQKREMGDEVLPLGAPASLTTDPMMKGRHIDFVRGMLRGQRPDYESKLEQAALSEKGKHMMPMEDEDEEEEPPKKKKKKSPRKKAKESKSAEEVYGESREDRRSALAAKLVERALASVGGSL